MNGSSVEISLIILLVIALALFFDFTNGFHDTANAMATPIATGAIKPKTAVALAAVLNLIGAFLSTEVAKTISGGLIREGNGGVNITPEMIFAGLIGAVVWNMFTWLRGLPSSSSHALFGGLIGAAVVGAGFDAVNGGVFMAKIVLPAVLAPLIAALVACSSTKLAYWVTRSTQKASPKRGAFRYGQILSSSLVALAHGTNDAQKTMGVITLVLVAGGLQGAGTGPQFWVVATCAFAIALGTYAGGWRIIHTLGAGLTQVKPAQGFAAESATASAILASSHLGFALSTTQVASGSVIGSGLGRKGASVKWSLVGKIVLGWLFTLPAAGLVGALAAVIARSGTAGVVIDAIIGLLLIVGMFILSLKDRVGPSHATTAEVDDAGAAVEIPTKKELRKAQKKAKKKAEEQAKAERKAQKKAKAEKAQAEKSGAKGKR